MKITLSTSDVARALQSDPNANWSYEGSYALAEHLEEREYHMGEAMELNKASIRCEYSEYGSLMEWAEEYFGSYSGLRSEFGEEHDDQSDDLDEKIRDFISQRGMLLEFKGGVIVSKF